MYSTVPSLIIPFLSSSLTYFGKLNVMSKLEAKKMMFLSSLLSSFKFSGILLQKKKIRKKKKC